jgi:hypothetical protein
MVVTDIEFCLRTARVLLSTNREKAMAFVRRVVDETQDPRMRNRVAPILAIIEQGDTTAAERWLDRALSYDQARRTRRDARFAPNPECCR